jgi:hypothetical protein
MLSRRSYDHRPGAQWRMVARCFNGQTRPSPKNLDQVALPFGRLVDEDDHRRIDIVWQSTQNLRYSGKAAGGPNQGDDLQGLIRSVKRLVHSGRQQPTCGDC